MTAPVTAMTYQQRLDVLRDTKLRQTQDKQQIIGAMDHDDWAIVLPPPELRQAIQAISSSGAPVTDVIMTGFELKSNHSSGAFFGPELSGENFRIILEHHPPYVDPVSSLAGATMVNYVSYRKALWPPELDYSHLRADQQTYQLFPGIGAMQHFAPDLAIGLALGWGGLLDKVRHYSAVHAPQHVAFYTGLEHVVLGMQDWIGRTAAAARDMAAHETRPDLRENLQAIAVINDRLVTEPPATFREACQWILWYLMAARMYNGSGALGQLDTLLLPYYERDTEAGLLTDEEAIFHLACLLLRDTAYIQLGGPDERGHDVTNAVSYLVLEAAHRINIPANIGVAVGEHVDPGLLRRGVEILFQDKAGVPKFLGVDNTAAGFVRAGYSAELGRQRVYNGCQWCALPGREYGMNDSIKLNLARVFEVALHEMMADPDAVPGVAALWDRFEAHLCRAVGVIAEGIDFHLAHMHDVFPELVLDLCSYGPVEKGRDASHGGVEFTNIGIDGAGLATVADSFAALEQRIEREQRLSWPDLMRHLESDWAGPDGERVRLMMRSIPRYGSGGSRADDYAERVSHAFTHAVFDNPTPGGATMLPCLFSWAFTIRMGEQLGATPNGRHAGAPIAHGSNPDPGFRRDGAPTALAVAIASVQPGYGNTAPMQIELDPILPGEAGGVDLVSDLIRTHFDLGGTQININVLDAAKVLEAYENPDLYPDLIVRVTGFSAYFASLSPKFRKLVVDRIISG